MKLRSALVSIQRHGVSANTRENFIDGRELARRRPRIE
jgi:hypothetical protein